LLALLGPAADTGHHTADATNQDLTNPQLTSIAVLSKVGGKSAGPPDLTLSASWGYRTKTGAIMPGAGTISKRQAYSSEELLSIGEGASKLLGVPIDVMLNKETNWRCVPTNVWNYRIGGYQVIKKWLSYRDESVTGRALTKDEAREVTSIVRRIAAIILLAGELDSNYDLARDGAFPWPANIE
jgi:hypothetical protein